MLCYMFYGLIYVSSVDYTDRFLSTL
uniref:Uncharacterized protein n=1 Tax=Arundo donax TaxID=35708 RepID=A0A0A8Y2B5_ARUDO